VAKEVIYQLDRTQDSWTLSNEEQVLQRELKFKCLGLASLARSIARQHSRLTFLREGDVNTEFFHLQVCHRGHKNFIDRLQHQGAIVFMSWRNLKLFFIILMTSLALRSSAQPH
jgi:hypothetical protein